MAEIILKQFLDVEGVKALVEDVKKEDAKALQSAKTYADSLASNYEQAGSVEAAKKELKEGTDAKFNDLQALVDAKAEHSALQSEIERATAKEGELTTAVSAADAKAVKAQGDVDALKTLVGELPEGIESTDVVGYIDEKTANIASDATVKALDSKISQAEKDIDAIEADYLKAADKTELEGKITANGTAIAEEKSRAEGVEGGLDTRLQAVEADYLKAADKATLEANIQTVSDAVTRLAEGVSPEEIDGVNDLIQYVKDHGAEVTAMQKGISDNKTAVEGVTGRMDTAEGKITAVEGAVATKVEKSAYDEKVSALENADSGLDTRLKAVEGAVGSTGSVTTAIEAAKNEAIETAATDASTKADKALADAKAHANGLNSAMDTRVSAVEGKAHVHENAEELALVQTGDVAKWNGIEAKANAYTDGKINTVNASITAVSDKADANEKAIATKAEESAVSSLNDTVEDVKAEVAANTSAINSFVAMSVESIHAMFA